MALTWQLPSSAEVSTLIGPRTWPLLVLVAMLVLAVMLVISTSAESRRAKDGGTTEEVSPEKFDSGDADEVATDGIFARNRHWVLLVLVVLYTVSMNLVGFLCSTIAFSFLCSLTLGAKRKMTIGMTTLAGTALVLVVFDTLLNIPLP